MQRIINKKPAEYPFEELLQNVREKKLGTALYVSDLNRTQVNSLITVLKTCDHGLIQVTFLDCKVSSSDLSGINGFNTSSCYKRYLYSITNTNFLFSNINRRSEKCVISESDNIFAGCSQLFNAIRANNIQEVTRLLKLNADVNYSAGNSREVGQGTYTFDIYRTPLEEAVINQNVEIVKLLLWHGADPNRGKSNLMQLAGNNALMFQVLSRAGCFLNYRSDSNPAALAEMLTTYDQAEKALLARTCQFAYMRTKSKPGAASEINQERRFFYSLMVQCLNEKLSLTTLAITKLDTDELLRCMNDCERHQEVTVYGNGFPLSDLSNDLFDEVIQFKM